MFKSIKTLLLATNLDENCMPAFELAASIATRYQATLVILHVFEKVPDYIIVRLKSLLGDKQWDELIQQEAVNFSNAQEALVAKKSSSKIIKDALSQFCTNAGIDDANCNYHSREIVVTDGELVPEIINQSQHYEADLIVLGARKGFLHDNRIGQNIKSVMRKSHIPVIVVPPNE